MSRQLEAIFVALKLQLQNHTGKPGAIFCAICRRDIARVSNMFETWCNFAATKIASSCRDKNRMCKRALREVLLCDINTQVLLCFQKYGLDKLLASHGLFNLLAPVNAALNQLQLGSRKVGN